MRSGHTSRIEKAIERIRQEIDRLRQEQEEALENAIFLGMTPEEARRHDARREQLNALYERLFLLSDFRKKPSLEAQPVS